MICKIRCEYVDGEEHHVYTDFAPTMEVAKALVAVHKACIQVSIGVDIPLEAYEIIPLGGRKHEK